MNNDINTAFEEYKKSISDRSLENVIQSGEGIVRYFASIYGKGLDYDDLHQAGLIGLFRAVKTFDENHSASFSTWASQCVSSEIRHYARSERRYNCPEAELENNNAQVNLQDNCGLLRINEIDINKLSNSQDYQFKIDDKLTLEQAIGKLDEQQRRVLTELYFKGLTQQQTADKLGLSQRCVSRIKCAAVKFLKELLDPSSFHLVDNSKSFKNISKERAHKKSGL